MGKCGKKHDYRAVTVFAECLCATDIPISDRFSADFTNRLDQRAESPDLPQLGYRDFERAVRTAESSQRHAKRANHRTSDVLMMTPRASDNLFLDRSDGERPEGSAPAECSRRGGRRGNLQNLHATGRRNRQRQRQERQAHRRTQKRGFHRHGRWRSAKHRIFRISEAAGCAGGAHHDEHPTGRRNSLPQAAQNDDRARASRRRSLSRQKASGRCISTWSPCRFRTSCGPWRPPKSSSGPK